MNSDNKIEQPRSIEPATLKGNTAQPDDFAKPQLSESLPQAEMKQNWEIDMRCPFCGGTHRVNARDCEYDNGDDFSVADITCPRCNGSVWVFEQHHDDIICPFCDGHDHLQYNWIDIFNGNRQEVRGLHCFGCHRFWLPVHTRWGIDQSLSNYDCYQIFEWHGTQRRRWGEMRNNPQKYRLVEVTTEDKCMSCNSVSPSIAYRPVKCASTIRLFHDGIRPICPSRPNFSKNQRIDRDEEGV